MTAFGGGVGKNSLSASSHFPQQRGAPLSYRCSFLLLCYFAPEFLIYIEELKDLTFFQNVQELSDYN